MIVTSLKYQKKGFRQKIPKLKNGFLAKKDSILIDFDPIYSDLFQLIPKKSKKLNNGRVGKKNS